MVFRAIARNGGLDLGSDVNKARLKEWLQEHEGTHLRIEDVKPIRSRSQNNYYWMYLEVVSRETGHTPEELHEWAKRKFLPRRFISVMGQVLPVPASTTALKKHEFTDYLDRICAETNVPLPNPEDAGFISNH